MKECRKLTLAKGMDDKTPSKRNVQNFSASHKVAVIPDVYLGMLIDFGENRNLPTELARQ